MQNRQTQGARNAGARLWTWARSRTVAPSLEQDGRRPSWESAVAFGFIDAASGRYEADHATRCRPLRSLYIIGNCLSRCSLDDQHLSSLDLTRFSGFPHTGPTPRAETPAIYGTKRGPLAMDSDEGLAVFAGMIGPAQACLVRKGTSPDEPRQTSKCMGFQDGLVKSMDDCRGCLGTRGHEGLHILGGKGEGGRVSALGTRSRPPAKWQLVRILACRLRSCILR
jgi:hypothetical protein